jgi:hypothetical protein
MRDQVNRAEEDGTDAAKLRAWEALKQIISWLGRTE